jgi:hypothetical protein
MPEGEALLRFLSLVPRSGTGSYDARPATGNERGRRSFQKNRRSICRRAALDLPIELTLCPKEPAETPAVPEPSSLEDFFVGV